MEENRRILIVDDNKDIHDDFKKILQPDTTFNKNLNKLEATLFENQSEENIDLEYRIEHAFQGDEALLKVTDAEKQQQPYALIFMDVRMPPGMDGIETIYRIWREHPLIEIVICTAHTDYSWDEIVAKLGATDKLLFIKKPFNAVEIKQMTMSLVRKWNLHYQVDIHIKKLKQEIHSRTVQLNTLLTELREKNRILNEMACRDNLTGLLNHVALYEQLNINLSAAKRHIYPLIVVLLDIDHFRDFTQTYGHKAGDLVIKEVAEVLKSTLRLYDITLRYKDNNSEVLKKELIQYGIVSRYGGDEFICIIPHCGKQGAVSIMERLRQKIKAIKIPEARTTVISCSIGVSILEQNSKCTNSRDLVKLADQALCQAKQLGPDQVCYLKYQQ